MTDIFALFTLGWEAVAIEGQSKEERKSQIQRRVSGFAGKQFFTTEKGLVGISTVPVKEGDTLAAIDASPAYYIIREVKNSSGCSYVAQRHQIIARVVLHENKDKMRKRFVGLEHKMFQIV
jgi:hypothetical protein